MKLLNDAISLVNSKIIYARAGDEVTVISDFKNVMIVENWNGNRFPCKTDNLTDGESSIAIEKPLTELKPIINQVQAKSVKRQKPAPLNNQSQLF